MASSEGEQVMITELVNCLGLGGTERQLVEQLRRVDGARYSVDLCCLQKTGELLEDVRALSIEPIEHHLKGTLLRPNTVVQVLRLARRMRTLDARLVHTHDFYSNLIGSAAARVAGLPCIVSRRDLGAWIDWKRAALLAAVTRRAPFVLCNAYAIRDHLVHDEGVDPARITVVYNGIDIDRFDRAAADLPNPALPVLDGPGPIIVLVANMKHELKGQGDMLRAASIVLRTLPEARFLFVGDGMHRAGLERHAHAMGIAHAVVFAGSRTDVPAILTRCHIGVCTSHSEGLSNSIMEAMAARLPVVATGVGGNVELVRDGRTGFIVPRGDVVGFAQRLLEIARHPLLASHMGVAARRRVVDELSSQRLGERLNELYAQVLRIDGERRRAA